MCSIEASHSGRFLAYVTEDTVVGRLEREDREARGEEHARPALLRVLALEGGRAGGDCGGGDAVEGVRERECAYALDFADSGGGACADEEKGGEGGHSDFGIGWLVGNRSLSHVRARGAVHGAAQESQCYDVLVSVRHGQLTRGAPPSHRRLTAFVFPPVDIVTFHDSEDVEGGCAAMRAVGVAAESGSDANPHGDEMCSVHELPFHIDDPAARICGICASPIQMMMVMLSRRNVGGLTATQLRLSATVHEGKQTSVVLKLNRTLFPFQMRLPAADGHGAPPCRIICSFASRNSFVYALDRSRGQQDCSKVFLVDTESQMSTVVGEKSLPRAQCRLSCHNDCDSIVISYSTGVEILRSNADDGRLHDNPHTGACCPGWQRRIIRSFLILPQTIPGFAASGQEWCPPTVVMHRDGTILAAAASVSCGARLGWASPVQIWSGRWKDDVSSADDIAILGTSGRCSQKMMAEAFGCIGSDGWRLPFIHGQSLYILKKEKSRAPVTYLRHRWTDLSGRNTEESLRGLNFDRAKVSTHLDVSDGAVLLCPALLPEIAINARLNGIKYPFADDVDPILLTSMLELHRCICRERPAGECLMLADAFCEYQRVARMSAIPLEELHMYLAMLQWETYSSVATERAVKAITEICTMLSSECGGGRSCQRRHLYALHSLRQLVMSLGLLILQGGRSDDAAARTVARMIGVAQAQLRNESQAGAYAYGSRRAAELSDMLVSLRKLKRRCKGRACTRRVSERSSAGIRGTIKVLGSGSSGAGHSASADQPLVSVDDTGAACLMARSLRGDVFSASSTIVRGLMASGLRKFSSCEAFASQIAAIEILRALLSSREDYALELLSQHALPIDRRHSTATSLGSETSEILSLSLKELHDGTTCADIRRAAASAIMQGEASDELRSGCRLTRDISARLDMLDEDLNMESFRFAALTSRFQLPKYDWDTMSWQRATGTCASDVPPIMSGAWCKAARGLSLSFDGDDCGPVGRSERENFYRLRIDGRIEKGGDDTRTRQYLPISIHIIGDWDELTFFRVLHERCAALGLDLDGPLRRAEVHDDEQYLTSAVNNAAIMHFAWHQDVNTLLTTVRHLPAKFATQPSELRIRNLKDPRESGICARGATSGSFSVVADVAALVPTFSHLCIQMISRAVEEELAADGTMNRLYWPSLQSFVAMLARSGLLLSTSHSSSAGLVDAHSSRCIGVHRLVHPGAVNPDDSRIALHSLVVRFFCIRNLPFYLEEHLSSHFVAGDKITKPRLRSLLSSAGNRPWAHALIRATFGDQFQAELSSVEDSLFSGSLLALDHDSNDELASSRSRLARIARECSPVLALILAALDDQGHLSTWIQPPCASDDGDKGDGIRFEDFARAFQERFPSLFKPICYAIGSECVVAGETPQQTAGSCEGPTNASPGTQPEDEFEYFLVSRSREFQTSDATLSLLHLLPMKENPMLRRMLKLAVRGTRENNDLESLSPSVLTPSLVSGMDAATRASLSHPVEGWEACLHRNIDEIFRGPSIEIGVTLGPDHHLRRGHPLAALTSALVKSAKSAANNGCQELRSPPIASSHLRWMGLSRNEMNELEVAAYNTAIDYFDHDAVVASCCAAIELCDRSAWPLRIEVSSIRRVAAFFSRNAENCAPAGDESDEYPASLARYVSMKKGCVLDRFHASPSTWDTDAADRMADALENVTLALIQDDLELEASAGVDARRANRLKHSGLWWLVQAFCKLNGLPQRKGFMEKLASEGDWVGFLAQAHADDCSTGTVEDIILRCCVNDAVSQHLLSSLKSKLSTGGRGRELRSQPMRSDASTSDSPIREGKTEELFDVVANAEEVETPGAYLLERARSLRWPILAVIASSFRDTDRRTCMGEWLRCTLVSHSIASSTEGLVRQLCRDGILLPLQRAVSLFFPGSALYLVVLALRQAMQHRQKDACMSFQLASGAIRAGARSSPEKRAPRELDDDDDEWAGRQMAVVALDTTLSSSIPSPAPSHRLRILDAACSGRFLEDTETGARLRRLLLAHEMLLYDLRLEDGSPLEKVTQRTHEGSLDVDVTRMQSMLCRRERWKDARRWVEYGGMTDDDITEKQVVCAISKCRKAWHSQELRLMVWEQVDALMLDHEMPADRAGQIIIAQVQSLQSELKAAEKLFILKRAKLWLTGEIVPLSNPRRASLLLQELLEQISNAALDEILDTTASKADSAVAGEDKQVAEANTSEFLSYYRQMNDEKPGTELDALPSSYSISSVVLDLEKVSGPHAVESSSNIMNVTRTPLRKVRKGSDTVDSLFAGVMIGTPPRSSALRRETFAGKSMINRRLFMNSPEDDEEEEEGEDPCERDSKRDSLVRSRDRVTIATHILLENGKLAEAARMAEELDPPPIELELVLGARTIAEHCCRHFGSTRKDYTQTGVPPAALLPVNIVGYLQRRANLVNVASASAMEYIQAIELACPEGRGRGECSRIRVTMEVSFALGISIVELETMDQRAIFRLLLIRATVSTRALLEKWVKHSKMRKDAIAKELVECFMNGLLSTSGLKTVAAPNSSDESPIKKRDKSVARSLHFSNAPVMSVATPDGNMHQDVVIEDERYTINRTDDAAVWNAKDFLNVACFCDDCVELGNALLSGAVSRDAPSSCQTELIVLAYHFFSQASPPCFDGMITLMAFAHACAEGFAANKDFKCLMRLIAGIGKYRTMKREFQLLAEHGELELLLTKRSAADAISGDGNIASLRLAVLQAIRTARPGDKDAEAMCYVHFDMYRSLANFLRNEAGRYATSTSVQTGNQGGEEGYVDTQEGDDAPTKSPSDSITKGSPGAGLRSSSFNREKLVEEVGVLLSAAEAFDQSGAPNAAARCGSKASMLLESLRSNSA